ncbi:MAG TPA: hypothetical protein VMD59_00105, partial [Acidimicrobiales bacterium]|nr:hypothetical protein [Acidimicrobiales bacterium]
MTDQGTPPDGWSNPSGSAPGGYEQGGAPGSTSGAPAGQPPWTEAPPAWPGAPVGSPYQPTAYPPGMSMGPGAPSGMYVDPASGILLPEGVVLAGAGRRIGAFFLSIVLAIVTLGIGYVIWGL